MSLPADRRDEGGATAGEIELAEIRSHPAIEYVSPLEKLEKSLTYWKLFRWRGMLLILIPLFMAIAYFILLLEYTSSGVWGSYGFFTKVDRPGMWVFFVFLSVCTLLPLRVLWGAKSFALAWVQRHHKYFQRQRKQFVIHSPDRGLRKCQIVYSERVGLNGTHYLWRLYLSEFLENWLQLFNMRVTYLCTLPLLATSAIVLCLIIESSYRARLMYAHVWTGSLVSVHERNRMVVIDMSLDLFLCSAPLALANFGYNIVFPIEQIFLVILFPTVSLLGKVRGSLYETIRRNMEDLAIAYESSHSARVNRKRKSMFGEEKSKEITAIQNKHFPRRAKLVVFGLSVIYAAFLSCTLIVHWATWNYDSCQHVVEKNGTINYYQNGCIVKVPFCQDMMRPRCDCASLVVDHHDMVELSEKFITMQALQRVSIESGPLRRLPENMENLPYVSYFGVRFNRLEAFDVDILKWDYLTVLKISFNNITYHHQNVWKHPNVASLHLNSNVGFHMPANMNEIYLPHVFYLHMGNNSSPLPNTLGSRQLPLIKFLYIDGNKLSHGRLPAEFENMGKTLQKLGFARTGMVQFPTVNFWSSFSKLGYIDARGNSISNISSGVGSWLEAQGVENYFSGNPICGNGHTEKEINCERLCSEFCWSRNSNTNQYCDRTCDSAVCEMDGGECLVWQG